MDDVGDEDERVLIVAKGNKEGSDNRICTSKYTMMSFVPLVRHVVLVCCFLSLIYHSSHCISFHSFPFDDTSFRR